VESQERNIVQLKRIEAMIERRWSSERENRKEESGNEEERSKDGSGESQEKRTPLSASC